MNQILGLVAEIEQKAVTIIQLAEDEKERLRKEEVVKRSEYEKAKQAECEKELAAYKHKLDLEMNENLHSMEKQSDDDKNKMEEYVTNNKSKMVDALVKEVIGA